MRISATKVFSDLAPSQRQRCDHGGVGDVRGVGPESIFHMANYGGVDFDAELNRSYYMRSRAGMDSAGILHYLPSSPYLSPHVCARILRGHGVPYGIVINLSLR